MRLKNFAVLGLVVLGGCASTGDSAPSESNRSTALAALAATLLPIVRLMQLAPAELVKVFASER